LSSGIGSPAATRSSKKAETASWALAMHASMVSPGVTQPGRAGTVTVKPPSSGSGSTTIEYVRMAHQLEQTAELVGADSSGVDDRQERLRFEGPTGVNRYDDAAGP